MRTDRFCWKTNGKALKENQIESEKYRFTVLTPSLIRMEYSEEGIFEDRATLKFFYRDFPRVSFDCKEENGVLYINTGKLMLIYRKGEAFTEETLSVELIDKPYSKWHFGEWPETLKGTARTLDQTDGPIPLEDGVLSKNGYVVIDDSDSMVLTEDGWFDLPRENKLDVYFFGYGLKYRNCLKDYFKLTGNPPLLPNYALGNWWSRYHKYTQEEYQNLILRFEKEHIPFSVSVVDMDWHLTKNIPETNRLEGDRDELGWTGWTWNKELFTDYKAFLKFIKAHNLKTAINLHPAQGIGTHETQYLSMCRAIGQNPEENKPVKLDILNPEFMEYYFDELLHPYEKDGVNFWWMDWQQGTSYYWIHDENHPKNRLEKMDPLWILNHLHIMDISRNGKRPMFFSRYAGLGSHRYPVGFSGDTQVSWQTLDFQPYFTATASNAGYCWWSHDIGGHHHGFRDDELMVRWIQFGVFSPINRLHSTDNLFGGKEPWNLGPYLSNVASNYLRMRHDLFPYLYAMNYRCHDEGETLIQPLYYEYPEKETAYQYRNEYFFGSEMIVAPITEKNDATALVGKTRVWIPDGIWTDAFNGYVYKGSRETVVCRPIEQVPVFCKAGAIIPMQQNNEDNKLGNCRDMKIFVYPGADNTFKIIEDEGDGLNSNPVYTECVLRYGQETVFAISGTDEVGILPHFRNWTIVFRGWKDGCRVLSDSQFSSAYDTKTHSYTISFENVSTSKGLSLKLLCDEDPIFDNSDYMDKVFDLILHSQIATDSKELIYKQIMNNHMDEAARFTGEENQKVLGLAIQEMLELGGHLYERNKY